MIGPDLFSFIDNLVQASYINQIFCPVLLMRAQPALGALPRGGWVGTGTLSTSVKVKQEVGSEQFCSTSISLDLTFPIVTVAMFETKNACLVFHRWQKQINKIGWLEETACLLEVRSWLKEEWKMRPVSVFGYSFYHYFDPFWAVFAIHIEFLFDFHSSVEAKD